MAKKDNVNHPKHYTSDPSGIECIDITRHRNFNVGNAIKYLWRAGLKIDADKSSINKQIEDLEKLFGILLMKFIDLVVDALLRLIQLILVYLLIMKALLKQY